MVEEWKINQNMVENEIQPELNVEFRRKPEKVANSRLNKENRQEIA